MPSAMTQQRQQQQHHHRSTTKQTHKPFKSRHATKSDIRDRAKGKIERAGFFDDSASASTSTTRQNRHQTVLSKLDRRNRAKQLRQNSRAQHVRAASVFATAAGAPRIVAVVPLCRDDVEAAEQVVVWLNEAAGLLVNEEEEKKKVGGENGSLAGNVEVIGAVVEGAGQDNNRGSKERRVWVERFKQNIAYVTVRRDMVEVLDACRMADFVVFVLDAHQEVDELGEELIRAAESQGISNVLAVAQGVESLPTPKKRLQTVASLKSYMSHFFPTIEKVNSLGSRQECQNVLRILCTTQPKGINWREDRSWMMVEDVKWPSGKTVLVEENNAGEVVLTGVVRGRGLKADRLVQVGDWGDYQIHKIEAAPVHKQRKVREGDMAVDMDGTAEILEVPSEDQDDLAELAPEEIVMQDDEANGIHSVSAMDRRGVLIDDHYYYSDEERYEPVKPKRLPRGTSNYQAAWYLGDDISDSGSDMEDVIDIETEPVGAAGPSQDPADGPLDIDMREPTEVGATTEYQQSEAFLDPSPEDEAQQIADYRKQRHEEAEEDLEFPDEIELPPTALARERLLRYRGLKNARTSVWDTAEDKIHEPEEWGRMLEIGNYKAAKNRTLKESLIGGVQPGMRVRVFLRAVPLALQDQYDPTKPLAMFSLLRHEHKMTAVNYSIILNSDTDGTPIKSKQEIIAQCGPRRFAINPLFSDDATTPNDVHKFKRYLHPGQSAVASFTGPLTWGSVPVLYFRTNTSSSSSSSSSSSNNNDITTTADMDIDTTTPSTPSSSSPAALTLIGTGTALPPSHTRIIAKRIILTGHPFKIHRKVVTVRYMFFNATDVAWFKALRLWTRRGRSGYIKQSLGTHGYFKATFDGKIDAQDAVAVSLYKRVWPRPARAVSWHA